MCRNLFTVLLIGSLNCFTSDAQASVAPVLVIYPTGNGNVTGNTLFPSPSPTGSSLAVTGGWDITATSTGPLSSLYEYISPVETDLTAGYYAISDAVSGTNGTVKGPASR
jgi:hypothetical protein